MDSSGLDSFRSALTDGGATGSFYFRRSLIWVPKKAAAILASQDLFQEKKVGTVLGPKIFPQQIQCLILTNLPLRTANCTSYLEDWSHLICPILPWSQIEDFRIFRLHWPLLSWIIVTASLVIFRISACPPPQHLIIPSDLHEVHSQKEILERSHAIQKVSSLDYMYKSANLI